MNKGKIDYIRVEQGNPVKSHLNGGELLQQIAQATKGFYISAFERHGHHGHAL